MAKYVVILVVVLFAAHLVLSRSAARNKTAIGRALHRTLESTLIKIAIAAGALIIVLVVIVLAQHLTS